MRERADRIAGLLAAAVVLLVLSGCGGTGAPTGSVPLAVDAGRESFGGWLKAHQVVGNRKERVEGEFLAVDADSLYLLARGRLLALPLATVHDAKVVSFDPQQERVGGWATAGSISTLSHGVGLLISAPVWIVSGVAMTSAQTSSAVDRYPDQEWAELRRHARFPQGPPPGLRRMRLGHRSFDLRGEPSGPPRGDPVDHLH
jgi:hypothetical protein